MTASSSPALLPPAGLAAAPDLRVAEPRPMTATLEGYVWLPRLFDKARATLAGTAGGYMFGCPVDHNCLARLGVSKELVADLVARHADDHAVLAELRRHGIPSAAAAAFDPIAVEDEVQGGLYVHVRDRAALPATEHGRVFAGADHGARVSVALTELAPGATTSTHRHPYEEVVVVVAGAAHFRLGERQQRIVRAGEVARIPAGAPHRYTSTGADRLVAVEAHPEPQPVTEAARA